MKYKLLTIILGILISTQIYAQVANNYAFSSSPNGGVFRVDDNEALDVTGDFTVEAWVYIDEDNASSRFIVDRADVWQFYITSSSVRFDLQATADLISTGVLSLNKWHHVAVVREGTDTKIFADGEKKASNTVLAMSAGTTPCVVGGQDSWFSGATTSLIDEVKFSNAAIYDTSGFTPSTTAPLGTDANTVFYFQFEDNTELPSLDDGPLSLATSNGQTDGTNLLEAGNYVDVPAGLPLSEPAPSSLTAHWKLDEGSGTVATEEINALDGTLIDLIDDNWIPGVDSNAIDFGAENVSGHIEIADHDVLNPDSNESFSISMLIKDMYAYGRGGQNYLLSKGEGGVYYWIRTAGTNFQWEVKDGATMTKARIDGANSLIKVNQWSHVVCVRDRSDSTMKIYWNGELALDYNDNTTGPISVSGTPLRLGASLTADQTYGGSMDDVKMFNYAVSPEEIATMHENYGDLTDPKLTAHWKMDDGKGWAVSDAVSTDGSGYGILMDIAPADAWVEGHDGKAIDFSSGESTSRIEVKDAAHLNMDSTNSFSISMLVTAAEGNRMLLMKGARGVDEAEGWNGHHYEVFMIGNDLRFAVDDNVNRPMVNNNVSSYMKPNSWSHFVCVRNRADSTLKTYVNGQLVGDIVDNCNGNIATDGQPLIIGNNEKSNWPFKGKMDDVQILNYAMSSEEIATMHENYGDLTDPQIVAHFKFDEDKGWSASNSVLTDGSGYGILKDLTPSETWIKGLVGNAIQNTEGNSAGHIEVADNVIYQIDSTESFSISFLQAPDYGNTGFESFVTRSTGSVLYEIFSNANDLRFRLNDGSKNVVYRIPSLMDYIAPNNWGLITCVRDRSIDSIKIYVNGEFIGGSVDATVHTISAPDIPLIIGNRQTLDKASTGKMDELKMFNYALGSEEIAAMAESYGDLTDPQIVAHFKFDEDKGWSASNSVLTDGSG
ncbi:MAG: LamG domain-containing protein, partial [Bacteroidota bacterium]